MEINQDFDGFFQCFFLMVLVVVSSYGSGMAANPVLEMRK